MSGLTVRKVSRFRSAERVGRSAAASTRLANVNRHDFPIFLCVTQLSWSRCKPQATKPHTGQNKKTNSSSSRFKRLLDGTVGGSREGSREKSREGSRGPGSGPTDPPTVPPWRRHPGGTVGGSREGSREMSRN